MAASSICSKIALTAVLMGLLRGPAADAAELPPLEAYAQLPMMEHVRLSPSGERLAFAASDGRNRKLYARTVAGQPLAMTGIDSIKLTDVSWAGERFVLAQSHGLFDLGIAYDRRFELSQFFTLDVGNGRIATIPDGKQLMGTAFGYYGVSQRQDRWVGHFAAQPISKSYISGKTYIGDVNLKLAEIDIETGKFHTLADGCKQCQRWAPDAEGRVLATAHYDELRGDWTLYAGTDRKLALASARDPSGENALLGLGRSPGTVLFVLADAGGVRRLHEVAVSGAGKATEILPGESVAALIHDPKTRLLIGYMREAAVPELVLFDPQRAARLRGTRKAFPNLGVRFESWSDDFGRFVVYTEGGSAAAADAGSYWLVDIGSGKAEVLGETRPQVRPEHVGPWRMVDYRAADGLALQGVLTLPPKRPAKNLPLVVLPHGGPTERDYAGFNWWAQAFASRGYAVWQPNFRGSTGYTAALRLAGIGEWGGKMQTDISDGIAELARQGIVDPRRACIVGASYGGYAALAGVTIQQGLYRCAVSVAGISDMKTHMTWRKDDIDGLSAQRYYLRQLGASSPLDARVAERSPLNLASRADAPVLLIHGKDDQVVQLLQSQRMHQALTAADKPAELVVLTGEDHYLSGETTRIEMLKAAMNFVQVHNPPAP